MDDADAFYERVKGRGVALLQEFRQYLSDILPTWDPNEPFKHDPMDDDEKQTLFEYFLHQEGFENDRFDVRGFRACKWPPPGSFADQWVKGTLPLPPAYAEAKDAVIKAFQDPNTTHFEWDFPEVNRRGGHHLIDRLDAELYFGHGIHLTRRGMVRVVCKRSKSYPVIKRVKRDYRVTLLLARSLNLPDELKRMLLRYLF